MSASHNRRRTALLESRHDSQRLLDNSERFCRESKSVVNARSASEIRRLPRRASDWGLFRCPYSESMTGKSLAFCLEPPRGLSVGTSALGGDRAYGVALGRTGVRAKAVITLRGGTRLYAAGRNEALCAIPASVLSRSIARRAGRFAPSPFSQVSKTYAGPKSPATSLRPRIIAKSPACFDL